VLATISNPEDVDGAVGLYASVGDTATAPTNQNYAYKGTPIWNDGLGIFLS
jgi:hypothetical protein